MAQPTAVLLKRSHSHGYCRSTTYWSKFTNQIGALSAYSDGRLIAKS
ncbi:hypothetical protein H6G41_31170 [Tolypothrix sp. FACHB-123]|nr:hypothetical protein [Tolypothrix sp. FACHB-123]MBD2358997.1 hypothetical protein [Tolypothrix sp. FACHB-123]